MHQDAREQPWGMAQAVLRGGGDKRDLEGIKSRLNLIVLVLKRWTIGASAFAFDSYQKILAWGRRSDSYRIWLNCRAGFGRGSGCIDSDWRIS